MVAALFRLHYATMATRRTYVQVTQSRILGARSMQFHLFELNSAKQSSSFAAAAHPLFAPANTATPVLIAGARRFDVREKYYVCVR